MAEYSRDVDLDNLKDITRGELKEVIGRPRFEENLVSFRIGITATQAEEFHRFMEEEGISKVTEGFRVIMREWVKGRKDRGENEL